MKKRQFFVTLLYNQKTHPFPKMLSRELIEEAPTLLDEFPILKL
jgi:hypothetical protein